MTSSRPNSPAPGLSLGQYTLLIAILLTISGPLLAALRAYVFGDLPIAPTPARWFRLIGLQALASAIWAVLYLTYRSRRRAWLRLWLGAVAYWAGGSALFTTARIDRDPALAHIVAHLLSALTLGTVTAPLARLWQPRPDSEVRPAA